MRALSAVVGLVVASTPFTVRAQSCTVEVPHVVGQWKTLPYLMPINPISTTLLRDGRILIVAGSENDALNNSPGSESYRIAVWNPAINDQTGVSVQQVEYDVFCSGTAPLPDGRPLVVGGTSDYSFKGDARASIFDPATGELVQTQNMADGRWYATTTTLGDGRVMTFSGLGRGGGTNSTVEIYDPSHPDRGWGTPQAAPFTPPLFPKMTLLPSGKVFYHGYGDGSTTNAWIFDPTALTWTVSARTTLSGGYGSAVLLPLLPPSYTPRVMNMGGGSPATSATEIVDLSASSPSYAAGPAMSTGRIEMNAVLLPNGKVLAEGGSVNNESPAPAGKRADLYDPVANSMSSGGTANFSRLYHSTALLLPDATVVSVGSNPGPRGVYEPAVEVYTPSYLFDSNDQLITTARPAITGVSASVLGYGAPFTVSYTSQTGISSAVLMRLGSTTHTFNMDQRLVGLCGASPQPACTGAGSLSLTTPPNGNVAPPGYYMLFLLDGAGVPSKAQIVQLTRFASAPPSGSIASPATDVIITAGSSVTFDTSTTAAKYSWVFPGGTPATATAQSPGNVTFSTPGTYTASLTVVDAAGNSDPSPATRTITVLPTSGDFDIAVSPSSAIVAPGGSATFTVTVAGKSGFASSVGLSVGSENGFPAGVSSGGFSPASIAGSGSATLIVNTTTSATPYALSLTVTGTAGTIQHTASTTFLVNLAPPASLLASGGNAQVSLSWPASTGATSYVAQRSLVNGGPYTTIACPTSTSYTDVNLGSGTTYYYVVSALYSGGPDAGGASADSPQASATTQAGGIPSAPTGLTATTGCSSPPAINLAWTASAGATSYNVKRSATTGGQYAQIGTSTTTSYTDSSVTAGATYYYVVSAANNAGESGNSSQAGTAAAGAVPSAPTGLAASTGNPRASISLRWTQSSGVLVTQNRIYRRTSTGTYPTAATASLNATTSYLDKNLVSGSTYCYEITAVSCGLESARTVESCAKAK